MNYYPMRFTLFFVCLLFFVSCSSEQKSKEQATPQTIPMYVENPFETKKKIKQLESELINAYLTGDTVTMKRLLSDGFTIGLPNGHGFGDKYTEIEGIKEPVAQGYVLKNDTMEVQLHENTAVVTKLVSERGIYNKQFINTQTLWTDVWVRKDTLWSLTCSHGTFVNLEDSALSSQ